MWRRRDFLGASAAAWLLAGLPRARAQGEGAKKAPRYFVTLFLRGGIDGVYTVDPKTRSQVAADVDVPYEPSAIVDAGGLQLGPHFAPLQKWAGKMAVVRGIQVRTANHESGALQMLRLRTDVTPGTPSLYDIIGRHRAEQPLATVTLGKIASTEHSPGALMAPTGGAGETTTLDAVDQMSDEDVDVLAASFKRHLDRFPRTKLSTVEATTREHVSQVAAFFERMKKTSRFKASGWGGDNKGIGEDLQRTLWLLENDLARSVFVKITLDWDSHFRNADKQARSNGDFVDVFGRFLTDLHARKNAFGTLADQTVVTVGSELGRFPVMNGNLGKDHFPEAPFMFFGPTIQTNDGKGTAFVPTGQKMEGLKVSLQTGQPQDAGGEHLVLDDVGTTLLHMAGIDPAVYGYIGRRLAFLERA